MSDDREVRWEKLSSKEKKEATLDCPYCATHIHTKSEAHIVNVNLGSIMYRFYKCTKCCMPIMKSLDGTVLPPSQALPFSDVKGLPPNIEKLYTECRKSFKNECFLSTIMVARTLLMHVAVHEGATANLKFIEYINFLLTEGHISKNERVWVDKIRKMGNQYIHEIDEATREEANKVMIFIKQFLGNVYEMKELAR